MQVTWQSSRSEWDISLARRRLSQRLGATTWPVSWWPIFMMSIGSLNAAVGGQWAWRRRIRFTRVGSCSKRSIGDTPNLFPNTKPAEDAVENVVGKGCASDEA